MERLRSAAVRVGDAAAAAAAVEAIAMVLPRLRLVHSQRRAGGRRIDAVLKALATAEVQGQHTGARVRADARGGGGESPSTPPARESLRTPLTTGEESSHPPRG